MSSRSRSRCCRARRDRSSTVNAAPPGNRPQPSPPRRRTSWRLMISSLCPRSGQTSYLVTLTSTGAGVRATVKTANQPDVVVTNIRAALKSLVLTYTTDFSGTLIPDGPDPDAGWQQHQGGFLVLDGQFEMSGTGTKGNTLSAPAQRPAGAAEAGGGARPAQPQVARVSDLLQMMAALPDTAPATPKQPRRVLVLARAAGFVHSSIPLAARTIEALGQKTGAWTTVITYDPADINDREPEAVRRHLPRQHDRHVPRRSGRTRRRPRRGARRCWSSSAAGRASPAIHAGDRLVSRRAPARRRRAGARARAVRRRQRRCGPSSTR